MRLQKKIFMLQKLWVDVTSRKRPFPLALSDSKMSRALPDSKLREYYFKFSEQPAQLNRLIIGFDRDGIPLNQPYVDVDGALPHYYPISIGQYGLAVFHSYLITSDEAKKNHFLRIADWFMRNVTEDAELGCFWLTGIPKPEYKIQQAWKSAFSQSRAISILLRAWQLTGKGDYLSTAGKALLPFTKDIKAGGVSANLLEGHPFYEEYVAAEPTMVLDGHIFSLFGLHEYLRAVTPAVDPHGHELAQTLFDRGMESLLYYLPEYDLHYWLRFNLCRMAHYPPIDPCTVGYLRLVTIQLEVLFHITKDSRIIEWHSRIKRYDHPGNIIKMYKLKFKVLKELNRL